MELKQSRQSSGRWVEARPEVETESELDRLTWELGQMTRQMMGWRAIAWLNAGTIILLVALVVSRL